MRAFLFSLCICFLGTALACAEEVREQSVVTEKNVEITVRSHDEPRPYDGERDAMADVDAAIAAAEQNGTKALVVMGANWCHDSRALAARFEQDQFQTLIAEHYELVYVSAGTEPGENDQNREISKRFGVEEIEGTPTIFIVNIDEEVLNTESTGYWRRAESIPVDMSYAYFLHYAEQ